MLKKEEEGRAVSLWARNLQLSVASIPLAALAVVAQWRPRHSSIRSHGLFAGFDALRLGNARLPCSSFSAFSLGFDAPLLALVPSDAPA